MQYTIVINPKIEKVLSKIDPKIAINIRNRIRNLADSPREGKNITKMKGSELEYRLRVGDYRIIYEIHDEKVLILIVNVGHRREVYR